MTAPYANYREAIRMMISETPAGLPGAPQQAERLKSAAQQLEASFMAQMLKSAGVGETPQGFGGGIGEDQFASFLRREQAREMAEAGGIGLAQSLFEAMMERRDV
ncbi:MAG: rod-binding protein [Salibaculum sp.]|jgi:Rod binding domain-containing protein|nr:rod-binding protein [Salibaculum sp.]